MEAQNEPMFYTINEDSKTLLQTKEYEYQINSDTYTLRINAYSDQTIQFYLKQTNKIPIYYYEKNFTYDQIINTLKLMKELYNDITKVFSFYDISITKKKIILKEDIKKKQMILNMQKEIDYMLIQCNIEMDQKQLKNEDMIQIITEEINKLKNIQKINTENQNQKNEEKVNKIEAKLKIIENEREKEKEEIHQMKTNWDNKEKELKNQIKELQEVIKNMKIIIDNNNKYIEEIKKIQKAKLEEEKKIEEEKKKQEELSKNKINIPFKENPNDLKYIEDITNNNSCGGCLYNFALFNGIKDNIEYIVYNNKSNYNIEIMRINDKIIINSLKGHNNKTTVIRYYINDNKEEYILSCDCNKLVIVWDIQNNYNKKYKIEVKYYGNIYDALLLFNIFNKNYILISSDNKMNIVNYMNLKIIHHL